MKKAALIDLHHETVKPNWVDYNGHMNVAYYVLVFDHATDVFLECIGLDNAYRKTTKNSVFVAEAHLTYEKEVMKDDRLRVSTQVLDTDSKRLHIFHRMHKDDSVDIVATNELMILGVDLTTRRVTPFDPVILASLSSLTTAHKKLPRPPQAGRIIGIRKG